MSKRKEAHEVNGSNFECESNVAIFHVKIITALKVQLVQFKHFSRPNKKNQGLFKTAAKILRTHDGTKQ